MQKIKDMQNVDLETVDQSKLIDISSVVIDESLPQADRLSSFVNQIKNPYCFKCGDIVVKVKFSENGETLEGIIEKMLLV